jgi:hypothetical protein
LNFVDVRDSARIEVIGARHPQLLGEEMEAMTKPHGGAATWLKR